MIDLVPGAKFDPRNSARAKHSAWRVFGRLLGYTWHYKTRLIASILLAFIVAGSSASIIFALGGAVNLLMDKPEKIDATVNKWTPTIDSVTDHMKKTIGWAPQDASARVRAVVDSLRDDRHRVLVYLSAFVLIVSFAGGLARFFQQYFAGSIVSNLTVKLGEEMFENVMQLSIPFFEQRPSSEILSRFTNDIFMVNRGLTAVLEKVFREPIKAVMYVIILLAMDWQLALTVLVVVPVIGYVMVAIGKKVKKSMRRSLEKTASMAGVAGETFAGITIVKAYCMEEYETSRVKAEFQKLRRHLNRMVQFGAAVEPSTDFLIVIGVIMFVMLGSYAVETGRLTGGALAAIFTALAMLSDPLRKLASVNNQIQACVASAERVFEFIDAKPDIVEPPNPIELPPLKQALRFENVHFSYDGKAEVLKGVNFEVKKGEMVALVGFSGGGKSTIVKMIPRFYDITGGRIAIDGTDIRHASFKSLRDQISIVTQDTILFNETIRDNIAFGREMYTEARVRQAATAAHASAFIENLPAAYETNIGESGNTLSGGQRQRLAIARAIIKDPSILILDEATSSLDSESEQAIQKAIEEFIVGRTTIVIAHRLSTVQRADKILVVDDGRIIEQGSHQELMAHAGLYRRLYDVQFATAEEKTA